MTVVSMSAKEFSRLDVLMDLEARRMTVRDACGLLRLKRRQVFRLLKDIVNLTGFTHSVEVFGLRRVTYFQWLRGARDALKQLRSA